MEKFVNIGIPSGFKNYLIVCTRSKSDQLIRWHAIPLKIELSREHMKAFLRKAIAKFMLTKIISPFKL